MLQQQVVLEEVVSDYSTWKFTYTEAYQSLTIGEDTNNQDNANNDG